MKKLFCCFVLLAVCVVTVESSDEKTEVIAQITAKLTAAKSRVLKSETQAFFNSLGHSLLDSLDLPNLKEFNDILTNDIWFLESPFIRTVFSGLSKNISQIDAKTPVEKLVAVTEEFKNELGLCNTLKRKDSSNFPCLKLSKLKIKNRWGESQKLADFLAIKEFLNNNPDPVLDPVIQLKTELATAFNQATIEAFHIELEKIEKKLYIYYVNLAKENLEKVPDDIEKYKKRYQDKGDALIGHFKTHKLHQEEYNTQQSFNQFEREIGDYEKFLKTPLGTEKDEKKAAAYRILLAVLGEGERRYFQAKI